MRILLSDTNLFEGEYWIATTTSASSLDDLQTQNNLNAKNDTSDVQHVTLKDLPEDFPDDENFDNFISSLGVEVDDINADNQKPFQAPMVDLQPEKLEEVPSIVGENAENHSSEIEPRNVSPDTDRNQNVGINKIQASQKSASHSQDMIMGSNPDIQPVQVQFIEPSSVSVDLNEVARKRIRLSQSSIETNDKDVFQRVEDARNAIHLIMFGNGDESENDEPTAVSEGGILVAESDEES